MSNLSPPQQGDTCGFIIRFVLFIVVLLIIIRISSAFSPENSKEKWLCIVNGQIAEYSIPVNSGCEKIE